MSGDISVGGIVGVDIVFLHVFVLGNSGQKDPNWNGPKQSCPYGPVNIVPHLLIKKMYLLESLQVVLISWSIGDCPESQIVHMCHIGPGLSESGSSLKKFVFVFWLI